MKIERFRLINNKFAYCGLPKNKIIIHYINNNKDYYRDCKNHILIKDFIERIKKHLKLIDK